MRLLFALACFSTVALAQSRVTLDFDSDWRFLKSDAPGAEKPDFPDNSWRTLNVPHDWSIEGPFDQKNPTGGAGAFLPAGTGWYRKHFAIPQAFASRRVFIDFGGVMANSDVWINGFHLGRRPYGYSSFRYELTGHLHFGPNDENLLAVRADNSAQPASRWYAGAGIYRHVRLLTTSPVHLDHWATFVSTPKAAADGATVSVQTAVLNQSDSTRTVAVQFMLVDPQGNAIRTVKAAPVAIEAGKLGSFRSSLDVASPALWDLDHPALYKLVASVIEADNALDLDTTPFGIRDARFEPATGFWLNGSNFKLKGVCLHQEAGGLGTAVPDRAWERRILALKQLGVNAIRTAHNPPSPDFLALCDRLGMLVMDESFDVWTVAKNPYDYHLFFRDWSRTDVADMVKRDRNHPSVILYSAGNEIRDTPQAEAAKATLHGLVDTFHEYDPTRPVTQALFRPNVSHDYDDGLADILDVIGQNYRENEILKAHADKPTRKIVGTENGHDRRVWLALRDNPPYSGQFLWTGIDYLGESRRWPVIGSGSGLLDRTGALKPTGMERESWWSDRPVVHIVRRTAHAEATPDDPGFTPLQRAQTAFHDWTPAKLDAHEETVEVYSNCEQVELSLNGKSLGSQPLNPDASPRVWKVPFEAGVLSAVGKNKGQDAASETLTTAGKAAKIRLTIDRPRLTANWNDVAYLTAEIVDEKGIPVPSATNLISFSVKGPGTIAAVDNGDNASHEPFQASSRSAYEGRCIAILRATATGRISVSAAADGLSAATLPIQSERH